MDVLLTAFARHLGCSADEARPVLADLLARLRTTVHQQGEVVLDEVGTFRLQDGRVHFEPTTSLLGVVNRSFAGLPPVTPTSVPEEPTPSSAATPAHAEPASSERGTLYSVPLESVEPAPAEAVSHAAEAAAAVADVLDWRPGPDWLALDADPVPEAPDEPKLPAFPTTGFFEAEPDLQDAPPDEPPGPLPRTDETDAAPTWAPLSKPAAPLANPTEAAESAPLAGPETATTADDESPEDETAASAPMPAPVEGDPHATLDEDLDALLADVWTPSEAPAPEHPLGPKSEPRIEDAEYEVVAPDPPPSSASPVRSEPFPPASAAQAGSTIDPLFSKRTPRPPRPSPLAVTRPPAPEPDEEPSRWGLLFWLLPLLALCAVLAFMLWPRSGMAPDSAPTETTAETFAEQAPPEGNGGGTSPSEVPPAAAADDVLQDDREDPAGVDDPSDVGPTDSAVPAGNNAPASSPTSPQASTTPPPTPAPLTAPGTIPLPLRGPTRVDPARGGVTWIIASGSARGAQQLSERYRQLGYMTAVLPAQSRGRVVYRVALGQFIDRAEALRFRELLPAGVPFSEIWILDFSTS